MFNPQVDIDGYLIGPGFGFGGSGGGGVWGTITGTLSNQTDLQNALNAKISTVVNTTNQEFAFFTSGGSLQSLGISLSTDGTLSTNSDLKVVSEKGTKTYADTKISKVPAAVVNNFPFWDTGGILKDSGISFDTSTTLGTSDLKISSQNAIKTYIDSSAGTVAANAIPKVPAAVVNNFPFWDTGGILKDSGLSLDTSTTLGTSDLKVSTQKAVKTYADTTFIPIVGAAVLNNITTWNSGGVVKDSGISIDSTTTLGTSDLKVPTQKAVKTYADGLISALTKSSVGLGNVDNTSDATKNSAAVTLTNKRMQPRVYSTTSTATLTPEKDTYDIFHLTAQAGALTIANHSTTTPADGETIKIRLLDNGTARAISFGTNYVAKNGVALPTTTVLSKNMEMIFEWNSNLSKYNLMSLGNEA